MEDHERKWLLGLTAHVMMLDTFACEILDSIRTREPGGEAHVQAFIDRMRVRLDAFGEGRQPVEVVEDAKRQIDALRQSLQVAHEQMLTETLN